MKMLVIAAHPDDEVLGCGGTMARSVEEGHEVHIAILGEGITSRYGKREAADQNAVQHLSDHTRKAAAVLGVNAVTQHGLPDNRFDSWNLLDVVKVIEDLVLRVRPDVVYTQHGGDLNIDHVVTFRATLTATRPQGGCPVRSVYSYAVGSSTEWAFHSFEPRFHPTTFVDISRTLERKIAAMQVYESEARAFPHPRSPESLRASALAWGSTVGLPAAEPFMCIRDLR